MSSFNIKLHGCSCACQNVPPGFNWDQAWILGGGLYNDYLSKVDQCTANGWLDVSTPPK